MTWEDEKSGERERERVREREKKNALHKLSINCFKKFSTE